MGISSPVLGLRPGRSLLSRSWKLPKPEILTGTPFSSVLPMVSNHASTNSLASRLLSPTSSNKAEARSAFVSDIPLSSSQFCTKAALQSVQHAFNQDIDLIVPQGARNVTPNQPSSPTSAACVDSLSPILVTYNAIFEQSSSCFPDGLRQAGTGMMSGRHQRKTAAHAGIATAVVMLRQPAGR